MTNEKTTQETTNKDRIRELERIRKLNELQNKLSEEQGTDQEAITQNEIYDLERQPLSIETEIKKRILLSWGGGSDGFDLYFNENKELLRGVYFSAGWGVYFESQLTDDEAEEVFNFYIGGCYE